MVVKIAKYRARTLIAVLAVAAVLVAGCGGEDTTAKESQDDNMKIGVVLPGPRDDGASSQLVADGVKGAAEEAGAEVSINDKVPPAQTTQVLRNLVKDGHDLIVTNGAENLKPVEQVAKQYPDTKFIAWFGGPTDVQNVLSAGTDPRDSGFMAGLVAGLTTKSGKTGMITGAEEPVFAKTYEGFEAGVAEVNPKATVQKIVSGDYFDAQKNSEAANALIDSGVDVFTGYLDAGQAVAARTAQKNDAYYIGLLVDLQAEAPEAVVTSYETEDAKVIESLVAEVLDGNFEGGRQVFKGIKDGFGSYGAFGDFVDADLKAELEALKKKYADGDIG